MKLDLKMNMENWIWLNLVLHPQNMKESGMMLKLDKDLNHAHCKAISFGGSTELDVRGNFFNVDFDFSYSFAEQDDTDNADATFRCEIRADKDKCIDLDGVYDGWVGQIDWSNPQTPIFSWIAQSQGLEQYMT